MMLAQPVRFKKRCVEWTVCVDDLAFSAHRPSAYAGFESVLIGGTRGIWPLRTFPWICPRALNDDR